MDYKEIEVRFLEIDKASFVQKLHDLGAHDEGEEMLEEVIFNSADGRWQKENKQFVRIRKGKDGNSVTYKHQFEKTADGTEEVEFKVDDTAAVEVFLERLGLVTWRRQQKLRHTFRLGSVTVDIDTWPRVPAYVELRGFIRG